MSRRRRKIEAATAASPPDPLSLRDEGGNGVSTLAAPPSLHAGASGDSAPAASNGAGLTAAGGWENWEHGPYTQFPPQRKLVMEYRLMARYDPTVKTALALLRTMILGKLGSYHHDDDKLREDVNGLIGRINGGARAVVSQLLSALWAGFAVPQLQWESDGSEWYVAQTELLHPFTFFPRYSGLDAGGQPKQGIALDKKTGRVETLTQFGGERGEQTMTHTRDQVIYWPAFRELREEVHGVSLLQAARPAWFAIVKLGMYWNTLCEKHAMETPVMGVPVGTTEDPKSGQKITWAKFIADLYSTLKPGQMLAVPMDPDAPWSVQSLTPKADGSAFEARVKHLEADLWLAMLTPQMLMKEPEHGSRAQADTMLDMMLNLVAGLRTEIGGENAGVLIEQLIKPLIIYNVGEQDDYGSWAWEPMRDADLERLARVLEGVERARSQAAMRGGMPEADERKLRETFPDLYAPMDEIGDLPAGATGDPPSLPAGATGDQPGGPAAARYG